MTAELKVGQKLWWVPNKRWGGPQREVTVEKVGRIWAHLNERNRIDKQTLIADGGEYSSPGRCYLSKAEYDEYIERVTTWNVFAATVRYKEMPDGVTVADITEAAKLLRIELIARDGK